MHPKYLLTLGGSGERKGEENVAKSVVRKGFLFSINKTLFV